MSDDPYADIIASIMGGGVSGAEAIAADDPYLQAGSILQPLLNQVASEAIGSGDYGEAAIGGLLSGLGGGITSGLSENYQGRAGEAARDVIRAELSGEPIEQPDILSDQAYQNIRDRVGVFSLKKAAAETKRRQEIEDAGLKAYGTKLGGLRAETDARGVGGFNPQIEKEVDDLRKEFGGLDEVVDFTQVERTAKIIQEAVKSDNPVSDQELVRYSILMIEPGMAVREGEQAAIAASASIPEQWKGQMKKAFAGEPGLTPATRQGMLELAERAYRGFQSQYDRTYSFYEGQAKAKGLPPGRISTIGRSTPSEEIFPGLKQKTASSTPGANGYDAKVSRAREILSLLDNPDLSFEEKSALKLEASQLRPKAPTEEEPGYNAIKFPRG